MEDINKKHKKATELYLLISQEVGNSTRDLIDEYVNIQIEIAIDEH